MSNLKASCSESVVVIGQSDLPLYCPRNDSDLWASHPRVFIPIEDAEGQEAICPYCGTKYILK